MTEPQPRVLVELGTELHHAARRVLAPTAGGRPRRAGLRSRRRSSLAALAAAVTAATVAAIILATGGAQRIERARGVEAAFVVFRRPSTPEDRLPASAARILTSGKGLGQLQLQPGLSRRVITTANVRVWIVPGRAQACLLAEYRQSNGSELACGRLRNAEQNGVIGVFDRVVVGLLPDGSHNAMIVSGDRRTPLKLTSQAFSWPLKPGQQAIVLAFTDRSGVVRRWQPGLPHAPSRSNTHRR